MTIKHGYNAISRNASYINYFPARLALALLLFLCSQMEIKRSSENRADKLRIRLQLRPVGHGHITKKCHRTRKHVNGTAQKRGGGEVETISLHHTQKEIKYFLMSHIYAVSLIETAQTIFHLVVQITVIPFSNEVFSVSLLGDWLFVTKYNMCMFAPVRRALFVYIKLQFIATSSANSVLHAFNYCMCRPNKHLTQCWWTGKMCRFFPLNSIHCIKSCVNANVAFLLEREWCVVVVMAVVRLCTMPSSDSSATGQYQNTEYTAITNGL